MEQEIDVLHLLFTVPSKTVQSYVGVLFGSLQGSLCKAIESDVCRVEKVTSGQGQSANNTSEEILSDRSRHKGMTINHGQRPAVSDCLGALWIKPTDTFGELSMDEIPQLSLRRDKYGLYSTTDVFGQSNAPLPSQHGSKDARKQSPRIPALSTWNLPILPGNDAPILRTTSAPSTATRLSKPEPRDPTQQLGSFPASAQSDPRSPRPALREAAPSFSRARSEASALSSDPRRAHAAMHDAGSAFSRTFSDASASVRSTQSRPRSQSRPRHARAVTFSQSAGDVYRGLLSRKNEFAALVDQGKLDRPAQQAARAATRARRAVLENRSPPGPETVVMISGAGRNTRAPHPRE